MLERIMGSEILGCKVCVCVRCDELSASRENGYRGICA